VTVSRATLHNASQVKDLGVTEGAEVRIERAGDVIPEVVEVIENGNGDFSIPDECPVCGSEVVEEGEYHFCSGGSSCPAQLKRGLEHYTSKQAMDIEGAGEKVADQLVESGLVEKLPDLYSLEKKDLVKLEKFGDKSTDNLLEEIENSKNPDLSRFIFGLGIRHVGSETARSLAEDFSLEELRKASEEQLREVRDIGPEVSESIRSFFTSESSQRLVDGLLEHVETRRKERTDQLEGLKLVFTGSLEDLTREEVTELLEMNGANVTSSVSGETDYLVTGENPGENKVKDAEKNDVNIIDEEKFREKILQEVEN
jgi:DNA ligase (NAD+)